MPTCFVIQPFDQGKFDKRYKDTFAPAISQAGYEPYRVDQDPGVSIPIEEIEKQIRLAEACLIDITLDNPNVWFEFGYAIAAQKELCIVCSTERTGKYPFDVQHRSIIRYSVESESDFRELSSKITTRLKALSEKQKTFQDIVESSPVLPNEGLVEHEIVCLCVVMENSTLDSDGATPQSVIQDMERLGFARLAAGLALEQLRRRGLLQAYWAHDYNGSEYKAYKVTDDGIDWLLANTRMLKLKTGRGQKQQKDLDDEIPF